MTMLTASVGPSIPCDSSQTPASLLGLSYMATPMEPSVSTCQGESDQLWQEFLLLRLPQSVLRKAQSFVYSCSHLLLLMKEF